MESIWIVCLEVLAHIDPAPADGKLGFINVVASAVDAATARTKVAAVLEEYNWHVIDFEDVSMFDPQGLYEDDLTDLLKDVMANPHHVLLSTLHIYKAN